MISTARRAYRKVAAAWEGLRGDAGKPRRAWLWGSIGLTSGAVAVAYATRQTADAHHTALQALQAGIQSAGHAAGAWLWERLQSLVPSPLERHAPLPDSHAQHPGTVQGYAARWLADWCSQPERSHVAVALGGAPLLDWLLDAATGADSDTVEQQQAQRALTFLLRSDATAVLLAERPGAVPALIQHCLAVLRESRSTQGPARQGCPDDGTSAIGSVADLLAALKERAAAGLVRVPKLDVTTSSALSVAPGLTVASDWEELDSGEVGQGRRTAGEGVGDLGGAASDTDAIASMVHGILGGGMLGPASRWGRGEALLSDLELMMSWLLPWPLERHEPSVSHAEDRGNLPAGLPGALAGLGPLPEVTRTPGAQLSAGAGADADSALSLPWLAAAWLASWAEAHPGNRDKLAELNVGAAIADVASQVSGRPGVPGVQALQLQLIRLVAALAQGDGATAPSALHISNLPSTARPSSPPASTAPTIVSRSRLPRAEPLSKEPGLGPLDVGEGLGFGPGLAGPAPHHLVGCLRPLLFIAADAAVDRDAPRVIAALDGLAGLLLHGGAPVAAATATEPLLPLLHKLAAENAAPGVQCAVVRTLTAMARNPASMGGGAAVNAHVMAWRDWLLERLCQGDKGEQGCRNDGEEGRSALLWECTQALAALAALPGLTGLQVTHYWLAALLAALGGRVWPYNAVVYQGPHENELLAGSPAADGVTVVEATPGATSAQGRTGPRQGPAYVDARALLDAVPVLPSHITSVASALEAASAAVAEEHEVPPEFDPSAMGMPAPLARAFYRQAAHAVDMMVVAQRVCQALEVLNALVAADPAKQRWLAKRGVLPLLYRLCHPSPDETDETDKTVLAPLAHAATTAPTTTKPGAPAQRDSAVAKAAAMVSNSLRAMDGDTVEAGDEPQRSAPGAPTPPSLGARLARWLPSAPWRSSDSSSSGVDVAGRADAATAQASSPPKPETGGPELPDVYTDHEGPLHLCLRRQVARLLAMLAVQRGARCVVAGPDWRPWLTAAAADADCRLASHATKALLNLEAFRPRPPESPDGVQRLMLGPGGSGDVHVLPPRRALPPSPVYLDMVHLLDPGAPHLWTLARQGGVPPTDDVLTGPAALPTASLAPSADVGLGAEGGAGATEAQEQGGSPATAGAPAHGCQDTSDARLPGAGADQVPPGSAVRSAEGGGSTLGGLLGSWFGGMGSMWPSSALAAAPPDRGGGPAGDVARSSDLLSHPFFSRKRAPGDAAARDAQTGNDEARSAAGSGHTHAPSAIAVGPAVPASAVPSSEEGVVLRAGLLPAAAMPPLSQVATPQAPGPTAPTDQPLVDVVFVHGIRGGPFITWRKPGSIVKACGRSPAKRSAAYLTQSHCWPSDWLPKDAPYARLLTIEYLAPVSGWEGESLPLEATVQRVMAQLEAAGVGARPLVFVAHSMGGLLIKEMLVRSLRALQQPEGQRQPGAALAVATRGIVFFATPHFGSGMAAMGWKLRYMPYAAPAPALARLTPGPHLVELNEALRHLHEVHGLRVVSMLEGQATQLAPVLPKVFIVPEASAYPGFGKRVLMSGHDHVSLCKPEDRQADAYTAVIDMITGAAQDAVAMQQQHQAAVHSRHERERE